LARLSFQNVPTKSGGVVSGNISTGAGSPFGSGGKYESQVAHIKSEIAKKPEGYYDASTFMYGGYDPLSFGITPDPVLNEKLGELRFVFEGIATENRSMEEERWQLEYEVGDRGEYGRYNTRYTDEWKSERAKRQNRIAELTRDIDANKSKEKSLLEKFQQEKMDAYAKAYMDKQLINQRPTPTAPAITKSPTSYLPLAVVGIVIVVILLFLRRRA